jgi:Cytochrome C oxidase, cbb3-type, subunit III
VSSWSALLALPGLLSPSPGALVPEASECAGCHDEARNTPPARFSFGVGKWSENQCYGCHAEMADIGSALLKNGSDNRAFGLPYRFDAMKRFSQGHGPFLRAPEAPAWKVKGIERIDVARLTRFLAHPPVRSDGSSMIPFPQSPPSPADVPDPKKIGAGKGLFESRCASCHATAEGLAQKGPLHLALFTAPWLSAYAEGRVADGAQRRMPEVSLSEHEARDVLAFLEQERRERVQQVDLEFSREKAKALVRVELVPSAGTEAQASFSPEDFLREGKCVHCHDGQHRAARAFHASPAGLRCYIETKGADSFVARLANRKAEVRLGVVGSSPGMPASVAPLSDSTLRNLVTWIQTACRQAGGKTTCSK